MKLPRRLLSGLVVLVTGLCASAAQKPAKPGPWITDFQRYAAQKNLEIESSYEQPQKAGVLTLSGLLRALPAPAAWPQWRTALTAATAQAPAGVERQRLQAGGWLLAYLMGDRAAVLAELPTTAEPASRVTYAVAGLRATLGSESGEASEQTPEQELEYFEQQLLALEPLDLAEVKRTLGGEENFARLELLLAAAKAMNEQMGEVYAEYEKTQDKVAAQTKLEALSQKFTEQHGAEQEALAPYMEKPLIERYVMSLYQDQLTHGDYQRTIMLPDLVKLAGRERAEGLLRRALRLPAILSLREESGAATK